MNHRYKKMLRDDESSYSCNEPRDDESSLYTDENDRVYLKSMIR